MLSQMQSCTQYNVQYNNSQISLLFMLLFLSSSQVKKVLQFMIYACYNSRLEISFLMDEFAMPPVVSDLSNEMQTPSGTSITTPLTGSESISEGLALMQGDCKDAATEEKKEEKGAKAGIKEKMSNMRKLFGTAKTSGKNQAKGSVDDATTTDGKQEDFVMLSENDGSESVASKEVISQELAEAMTDTDRPSMKAICPEQQGILPGHKYTMDDSPEQDTPPQVQIMTSEDIVQMQQQYVEPDHQHFEDTENTDVSVGVTNAEFDHEATTKRFVSTSQHLGPNIDQNSDTISIASYEDILGSHSTAPGDGDKGCHFADALNMVTLSVSPFLKYSIPYMETSTGKASKLKKYLSPELFWSEKFANTSNLLQQKCERDAAQDDDLKSIDRCTRASDTMGFCDPHPFTFSQLTRSANEDSTRTLLADFRARGGRIVPKLSHTAIDGKTKYNTMDDGSPNPLLPSPTEESQQVQSPEVTMPRHVDCLDLYSHQHIALQFSSYSHMSSNAPAHCVHPWVVTMDFYGNHDLTLGEFLEKFCFR